MQKLRVAMYTPMPPSKSGIADYSEALAGVLGERVDLQIVTEGVVGGVSAKPHGVALYQIGNNPCHAFAYEAALQNPGIVVMHEANLHHLITDITINRNDWDAYVEECAYNGGPDARAFAERVRAREVGPDYDLPMTRRILESARGVIAHSHFVASLVREQGFTGPLAVIPHGAWLPSANRNAAREELGLDPLVPLIGAFGYLKPYKRIAESLRAFRRLIAVDPRPRMILVGEPHPDFPVHRIIRTLGLDEYIRVIGFAPTEKFAEYIGACDIVLNLRWPTVGETSGSLQRALGLGKAVLVSDVGSFAELPDDICLKVPAGPDSTAQEEDLIFEYLHLLVARPELAAAMGNRARAWVERECSWNVAGDRYAEFIRRVNASEVVAEPEMPGRVAVQEVSVESLAVVEPPVEELVSAWVTRWVTPWVSKESASYAARHTTRFAKTLSMIPPGSAEKSILEMGAYMQITPALRLKLNYGYVRGCYYGKAGKVDHMTVRAESGEVFECDVDHFDAEKDVYPYADTSFDTVVCCELIEHLNGDPMHLLAEVNRILKPGGHLLITTPNISSFRALSAILLGYHPSFFPAYIRPRKEGEEPEARHNREYVPMEMTLLMNDGGFDVERLETGEFLDEPHPEFAWIRHMLDTYKLHTDLRGDGIYVLGRKTGPVRRRWPEWLYQ